MRRRYGVVLVAGLFLVATGGAAAARPMPACAEVTDARGDAAFKKELTSPYGDVSLDREGGWTAGPLDILGARVSADSRYLTTTVHVAAITDDPVRGYVWRVFLEPDAPHALERIETIARRVTGGDTFEIHHEYQAGSGLLGGPGMQGEFIPATGSIDVARGLVHLHIPLTLLDKWHIKRSARLRDLHARSRTANGIVVGPLDWSNNYEGDATDETTHKDPRSRLNSPGCAVPA